MSLNFDKTCAICFENPNNVKLDCSHILCEPCFKKLSSDEKLQCPFCRRDTKKQLEIVRQSDLIPQNLGFRVVIPNVSEVTTEPPPEPSAPPIDVVVQQPQPVQRRIRQTLTGKCDLREIAFKVCFTILVIAIALAIIYSED